MTNSEKKGLRPGWRYVQLGAVVENVNDFYSHKDSHKGGEAVRYVAGEHIEEGELRVRRFGMTSDDLVPPTFNRLFKAGDVLFHSRNIRKLSQPDFDGLTGEKLFVLRTRDDSRLVQDFLPVLLQTDEFKRYVEGRWAGSTNKFLNKTPLMAYEFALPPVQEQKRICSVMSSIQDALDAYRDLEERANDLAQSRADDWLNRLASFPSVEIRRLCAVDRPLCYGVVQPGNNTEEGIPLIRVCDIESPEVALEGLSRISASIDGQYQRSRVKGGDVLVSIVGTIGRVFNVPDHCEGFNIARAIARISPAPGVSGRYLAHVLRTTAYQRGLSGASFETARKTLNLEELGKLSIPLPPIDQQDQVVEDLDRLNAISNRVHSRTLLTVGLRSQILAAMERARV